MGVRRVLQSQYWSVFHYPLVGLVVGTLLGGAVLSLDRLALHVLLPGPRVPADNVSAFLSSVAGGTITATAVLFWIRGVLVQLSSGEFSNRVLRWYLEDRFQQLAMAYLLGAFAFVSTVLMTLPSGEGAFAPPVSTGLTFLASLGVLLVIVAAISQSVRATRPSAVVARVTARIMDAMDEEHPHTGDESASAEPPNVPAESVEVRATESGWVQDVDVDTMLRALPEGTTVWVLTRAGAFIMADATLACVHPAPGDEDARAAVRDAVLVSDTRGLEMDVGSGVGELVDVAVAALSPGTGDETLAYEVVQHLGYVMRELLVRDLPPALVDGDDGRRVALTQRLTYADHVHHAFDQVRFASVRYPSVAMVLLDVFGMLVRHAESAGVANRADAVRGQAHLVVKGVRGADLLDEDRERVLAVARKHGFA